MNDSSGWIKIHRSILEWEWWDDRNTRDLFIFIIISANHKSKTWHGKEISVGSFVTSLQSLAFGSGLSVQQVRTSLNKLKSTGEITDKSTNEYRIITVCNYDRYQTKQDDFQQAIQQIEQQASNKQITSEQQANNNNQEYKNERIIIESIEKDKSFSIGEQCALFDGAQSDNTETEQKKKKAKRERVFIKPTIDELQNYINERGYSINAEYFFNKYESVGWMNGGQPVKNWKALVNTWGSREKPTQQCQPITQDKNNEQNNYYQ